MENFSICLYLSTLEVSNIEPFSGRFEQIRRFEAINRVKFHTLRINRNFNESINVFEFDSDRIVRALL